MKVLIDTNILIDYFIKREPFYKNAKEIITKCGQKEIEGYVAAHSVMNTYYTLRKDYSSNERRKILYNLCQSVNVVNIDETKIKNALLNADFKDMEDCLQAECAAACGAKYIITRNIKDFQTSKVTAILPEDFLSLQNKLLI